MTPARRSAKDEPPHDIELPPLTPFSENRLERHGDYDAVAFDDLDLSEQTANNASFLDCGFTRCRADDAQLRRARFVESRFEDLVAVSLDLTEAVLRDSVVTGGRIGALVAAGAQLARVRVRGGKYDFVNLRGAAAQQVVFEDCVITELDATNAALTDVAFPGSRVDDLNLGGAELDRVDLSGAQLQTLRGLDGLRGAIVSSAQLLDLAPLLAEHLGLTLRD
jgi:uncharacterized protein YjbI with pentapeptide repeats